MPISPETCRKSSRPTCPAVPKLGQRGQVRLVLDADGAASGPRTQLLTHHRDDIDVGPPAQVRRPAQNPSLIDETGQRHSDAGDREATAHGDRSGHVRGPLDRDLRCDVTVVGADDFDLAHVAAQIHDAGGDVVDVDLDAQTGRPIRVERQRAAGPSTGTAARLALDDEPGGDQLVDQAAGRRPSETGGRSELGSGQSLGLIGHHAKHEREVVFTHALLTSGAPRLIGWAVGAVHRRVSPRTSE